jgi:hypothetical protein
MPVRPENAIANPQHLTKNPDRTTVTATIRNTTFVPQTVQVTLSCAHPQVTIQPSPSHPLTVTVPPTIGLTPGRVPFSKDVSVSSTGPRPINTSIDITVNDPTGPPTQDFAEVTLEP